MKKQYVYYACGEKVESIRFFDSIKAWDFVENNYGYDCVVEMMEGLAHELLNDVIENEKIIEIFDEE